jgi:hypothetical protein
MCTWSSDSGDFGEEFIARREELVPVPSTVLNS